LTYSAPLYIDVRKRVWSANGVEDPVEADWQPALDENGVPIGVEEDKFFIGKVCST